MSDIYGYLIDSLNNAANPLLNNNDSEINVNMKRRVEMLNEMNIKLSQEMIKISSTNKNLLNQNMLLRNFSAEIMEKLVPRSSNRKENNFKALSSFGLDQNNIKSVAELLAKNANQ